MSLFNRHKHEWIATGAKVYNEWYMPLYVRELKYQTGQHTKVLYACKCGKNKTKSFDGAWTLEQIRGKT